MIKLRYTIYRRSVALGSGLLMLCFVGIIIFREERWIPEFFEILLWTVGVVGIAFHVVVTLLKKAGLLEFTYTEADRCSYLYNQEKLHQQMTENRRARKRKRERV